MSPKVLKKIDRQDFIPVVSIIKPESPKHEELKVVDEDWQLDLKAIPIYPFKARPGLTFREAVMEKIEYYKDRQTIEVENKKRYDIRNFNKK